MSVQRIRRNDTVAVVKGVNTGRTGKVLAVTSDGRVLVEGLNLRKKAMRPTQENPKGRIIEKECPIAGANVMPYCPACKKGVRLTRDVSGPKSVRKCRRCGHGFDA